LERERRKSGGEEIQIFKALTLGSIGMAWKPGGPKRGQGHGAAISKLVISSDVGSRQFSIPRAHPIFSLHECFHPSETIIPASLAPYLHHTTAILDRHHGICGLLPRPEGKGKLSRRFQRLAPPNSPLQTLLARNYRGDIPMSAVEKFPILLSDAEEESSAVPPCFSDEGINVRSSCQTAIRFFSHVISTSIFDITIFTF
jgi:hypothetical protein